MHHWLNPETWERDGQIEFEGVVSSDQFRAFCDDEGVSLPPGRIWNEPRSYYVTVDPTDWNMKGREIWNFALPGPDTKRVTIVRQMQDPEYRGRSFSEFETPEQLAIAMEGK
jgi:hypothetical protein